MVLEYLQKSSISDGTDTVSSVQVGFNSQNGWNLLHTLEVLSHGHISLIEIMVVASIPSTLVKCIFIFLDLPALPDSPYFQLYLKSLLQHLCKHNVTSEELVRKKSLQHLFTAAFDWCQPRNTSWRSVAATCLSTLAQHSLTPVVIKSIHESKCIAIGVKAIRQSLKSPMFNRSSPHPHDLFDSLLALLDIVCESSSHRASSSTASPFILTSSTLVDYSSTTSSSVNLLGYCLLDDFHASDGYSLLAEFTKKFASDDESGTRGERASAKEIRTLVSSIVRLVSCGPLELWPTTETEKEHPSTVVDSISSRSSSISTANRRARNLAAYNLLYNMLVTSSSSAEPLPIDLGRALLSTIVDCVYLQDPVNYTILLPSRQGDQSLLGALIDRLPGWPSALQEAYFDFLSAVIVKVNHIPSAELTSLGEMLRSTGFTPCLDIALRCFIRLVREQPSLKDVYRNCGLLSQLIFQLTQSFAEQFDRPLDALNSHANSPPSITTIQSGLLLLDLLRHTLTSNPINCDAFLQSTACLSALLNRLIGGGGARHPASLTVVRQRALDVVEGILTTTNISGSDELLTALLNKLHNGFPQLKIDILHSLGRVTRDSHRCRTAFRRVNGFVYLMQELVYMEGFFAASANFSPEGAANGKSTAAAASVYPSRDDYLADLTYSQGVELIRLAFVVIGLGMKFEPANAAYFAAEVRYSNITYAIVALGSIDALRGNLESTNHNKSAELSRSSSFHLADYIACIDRLFSNPDGMRELLTSLEHSPFGLVDLAPRWREQAIDRLPLCLIELCFYARLFYDLSIDAFDRDSIKRQQQISASSDNKRTKSPPTDATTTTNSGVVDKPVVESPDHLQQQKIPVVVHTGPVNCLLELVAKLDLIDSPVPSSKTVDEGSPNSNGQSSSHHLVIALQTVILTHIERLCQLERNSQTLTSAGLLERLLFTSARHLAASSGEGAEVDANSSLVASKCRRLFELLAEQSISPNELRTFLRLLKPSTYCYDQLTESPPPAPTDLHSIAIVKDVLLAFDQARKRLPLLVESTSKGPHISPGLVKAFISAACPSPLRFVRPAGDGGRSLFNASSSQSQPPFVEFDLSLEGFAGLLIPSLAPYRLASPTSQDTVAFTDIKTSLLSGGVGSATRPFPPPHGFTYSSWICIQRFDEFDIHNDNQSPPLHPIVLMSVLRSLQGFDGQIECLRIYIDPLTRHLVVSTQESLVKFGGGGGGDRRPTNSSIVDRHASLSHILDDGDNVIADQLTSPPSSSSVNQPIDSSDGAINCELPCNTNAVFESPRNSDFTDSWWPLGVWRHVAIVFNRAGLVRGSSCSLYLDGLLVAEHKLAYISSSSSNHHHHTSVSAFIGTPPASAPQHRRLGSLVWRQGPCHFIEEVLGQPKLAYIVQLGPSYLGSFRSPPLLHRPLPMVNYSNAGDANSMQFPPLFTEDKLVFGLHASKASCLTLAKLRKIYTPTDARIVAKHAYLSPKDSASPLRLLHNTALHLQGPARPLGAVLIAYQGVRIFDPSSLSLSLSSVAAWPASATSGQTGRKSDASQQVELSLPLALVAVSSDIESLYAAVKAVCVVAGSGDLDSQGYVVASGQQRGGYRLFAMLLRKKKPFLSTRILDAVLSLFLTPGPTTTTTTNHADVHDMTQLLSVPRHPGFDDLLGHLDLWRIERKVSDASPDHPSRNGHQLSSSSATFYADDYSLVSSLLTHLCELVPSIGTDCSFLATNSQTRPTPPSSQWITLVFDRLCLLLLDAHQTWTSSPLTPDSTSASSSTNQIHPVALVVGRSQLIEHALQFIHLTLWHHHDPARLIHRFGQLISWTLQVSVDQKAFQNDVGCNNSRLLTNLRHQCFHVLLQLATCNNQAVVQKICSNLVTALNFDWFYPFLQADNLDESTTTVCQALHLLTLTLVSTKAPSIDGVSDTHLTAFAATGSGNTRGWLQGVPSSSSTLQSNSGYHHHHHQRLIIDGSSASSSEAEHRRLSSYSSHQTPQLPGFGMLHLLLPRHAHINQLYHLVIALLLRIPIRQPVCPHELIFDALYSSSLAGINRLTDDAVESSTNQKLSVNYRRSPSKRLRPASTTGSPPTSVTGLFVSLFTSSPPTATATNSHPVESAMSSSNDTNVDRSSQSMKLVVCHEAGPLLLRLLSALIVKVDDDVSPDSQSNRLTSAKVVLRFLLFLYQTNPSQFLPLCLSIDFLTALLDVLFASASSSPDLLSNERHHLVWPRLCQVAPFKTAFDLFKQIVTDSFLLSPSSYPHQPTHVVDLLLETPIEHYASRQHQDLQTQLLCALLQHVTDIDLINDRSSSSSGLRDFDFVPLNLTYFVCRLVDKLWQGVCFSIDIMHLVNFITHLITHWPYSNNDQSDSPSYSPLLLHSLYRSLNRSLLFQLSRPVVSQRDQLQIVELLKAAGAADEASVDDPLPLLLFDLGNADPDLAPCLVHLLLQLANADQIVTTVPTTPNNSTLASPVDLLISTASTSNTKYYRTTFDLEDVDEEAPSPPLAIHQAEQDGAVLRQIAEGAVALWTKCYQKRKMILADLIPEAPFLTGIAVPRLTDWAPLLESPCLLAWASYVDEEASGLGGFINPPNQSQPSSPTSLSSASSSVIGNKSAWGRLPGLPTTLLTSNWSVDATSTTTTTNVNQISPSKRLNNTSSTSSGSSQNPQQQQQPSSPPTSRRGLHHQLSFRLNKATGGMIKFGMASSSTDYTVTSSRPVDSKTGQGRVQQQPISSELVDPRSLVPLPLIGQATANWYVQLMTVASTSSSLKTTSSPASSLIGDLKEHAISIIPRQVDRLHSYLTGLVNSNRRDTAFVQRQLTRDWLKVERELTRERGLWGPPNHTPLISCWQLDPTEGPCRMRKRLAPNSSTFFQRYPLMTTSALASVLTSLSSSSFEGGTDTRLQTLTPEQLLTALGSELKLRRHKQAQSRLARHFLFNFFPPNLLTSSSDWGPLSDLIEHEQLLRQMVRDCRHQEATEDGSNHRSTSLLLLDRSSDNGDFSALLGDISMIDLTTPDVLQKTFTLLQSSQQRRRRRRSSNRRITPATSSPRSKSAMLVSEDSVTSEERVDENESQQHEQDDDGVVVVDLPHSTSSSLSDLEEGDREGVVSQQGQDESLRRQSDTIVAAKPQDQHQQSLTSHQLLVDLLEPNESLSAVYRCARVLGLDIIEGLALFGRRHCYLIDRFTLLSTRELVDLDELTEDEDVVYEPVVPCGGGVSDSSRRATASNSMAFGTCMSSTGYPGHSLRRNKQFFKFPYESIQDVQTRRYLLQPIAIEVFNTDGSNFFLVFSKGLQSKVFSRFQQLVALHSVVGQQQLKLAQKQTPKLLSSFLGEKTMTQRWQHGEISNFHYLVYLNTRAGRSYNDLMQYPVFPWILADYWSEELDLTNPKTFRDLAKPMGAQGERRCRDFQLRFTELEESQLMAKALTAHAGGQAAPWDEPETGLLAPYHYATHYSSAMIVVAYLVRMEPFTQHFLKLQDGHFDLPDRMFASIGETWKSASEQNMSDVRELIPEFFYLPDFLSNVNQFELGVKQNGTKVDNVELPPWAKQDPREFIRVHREALESEYVSSHLHEWIDLIFGHKQSGPTARSSTNVFHPHFYEGNVDIYAIDNPDELSAVIGFINNFGQIPKRLFTKPHPPRQVASLPPTSAGSVDKSSTLGAVNLFYRNIDQLKMCPDPVKVLPSAVGQIIQLENSSSTGPTSGPSSYHDLHSRLSASLVALEQNKCIFLPPITPASTTTPSSSSSIASVSSTTTSGSQGHLLSLAWGFADGSLVIQPCVDQRADQSAPPLAVFEMVDSGEVLCCTSPNRSTLITGGLSTALRIWRVESYHQQATTNSSHSNSPLPSSSSSAVPMTTSTTLPVALYYLSLQATLCGHSQPVTCMCASNSFNLIVSGSRDRSVILWDLNRRCYVKQLLEAERVSVNANRGPITSVCVNEANGDIAACSGLCLFLWTCNGQLIAWVNVNQVSPDQPRVGALRTRQLLCVAASTLVDWDSQNVLLTGSADGIVRLWSVTHEERRKRRPEDDDSVNGINDGCHREGSNSTAIDHAVNSRLSSTSPDDEENFEIDDSQWKCQLTLRGQLTPPPSGQPNSPASASPVAITSLTITSDHKSVLVGDSRGCVWAWTTLLASSDLNSTGVTATNIVSSNSQKLPSSSASLSDGSDETASSSTTHCATDGCSTRFSLAERRYVCSNCTRSFCSKCGRFESEIHHLRLFKPVRVCQSCFKRLAQDQEKA